ncbi:hypothetical protein, partial [Bifidobacterium aemilianum]
FATLWLNVPDPDFSGPGAQAMTPADTSGMLTILGYAKWVGYVVAAIALVGAWVEYARASRSGDDAGAIDKIVIVLLGVVGIGAATGLVSSVLQNGPTNLGGTAAKLQSHLWFYMLVVASISVISGFCRMMWRHEIGPGRDTLASLLRLIIVAGAGTTIVQLGFKVGDAFSTWLLDEASGKDFSKAVTNAFV